MGPKLGALLLAVPISACLGGDAVAPPQAPPPPPVAAVGAPSAIPAPPPPAPEPMKPSLLELQKQAVAAAVAAMNAHDAKKFSELFAPDATVHEHGLGEAKGREAIGGGLQGALNGFPDFAVGVSKVFVKNEVLAQEWVIAGTNRGEFNGAKPTNKAIGVRVASVLTFTPDGLIQTEHRYWDTSTLLSQLGMIKAPARPIAALPRGEPEWHVARGTPEEDKQVEVAKTIHGAFETKSEPDFLGALSENVLWSDLTQPKDLSGKASAKQLFARFTKAFANTKFSAGALFGADDVVVSESALTATHVGSSGNPVEVHGVDILVVKNAKMTSVSRYSNSFELNAGGKPAAERK